jgi:propanol-preferring alcohol dehydrogenase
MKRITMTETMKALQYVTIGEPVQLVDVEKPHAGPGQIVLKVTAAGVCHSDEFIMSLPQEIFEANGWRTPMTLGHEGAGIVHELGEGVTEFELGDSVLVYGPWGCGTCNYCVESKEMLCPYAAELGIQPPGIGAPGAMAEYILIDNPRHLIPLGDLDPVRNVSLTDAALTPYHAIKNSLGKLGAGCSVVVIGAGGLGHLAIQILLAITGSTIIALDVTDEKLLFAQEIGAHHALHSSPSSIEAVKNLTKGIGANVVLDFVGIQATVDLAAQLVRPEGDIHVVGIGGGLLPVGFGALPFDVNVRSPYWGSRLELIEVIELAQAGKISVEYEQFSLKNGPEAYAQLHRGALRGRAVLVP